MQLLGISHIRFCRRFPLPIPFSLNVFLGCAQYPHLSLPFDILPHCLSFTHLVLSYTWLHLYLEVDHELHTTSGYIARQDHTWYTYNSRFFHVVSTVVITQGKNVFMGIVDLLLTTPPPVFLGRTLRCVRCQSGSASVSFMFTLFRFRWDERRCRVIIRICGW